MFFGDDLGAVDHELEAHVVGLFGGVVERQCVVNAVQCLDVFVQVEKKELGGFVRVFVAFVVVDFVVELRVYAQIQVANGTLVVEFDACC